MARDEHRAENASPMQIAGVVVFYMTVSLSLVFLNKYLMNYSALQFPYPLVITLYQFFVAWFCLILLCTFFQGSEILGSVPPLEFEWSKAREILPLTGIYLCMILFNNLCLKYVEVSFYQVARSLTIFFNLAVPFMVWGQKTSGPAVRACLIVVAGFLLGVQGEVRFTWLGTIFGVLSSLFVALYGIFVKSKLQAVGKNEWRLLMYNTPMATIALMPIIFMSEEMEFVEEIDILSSFSFWFWMTVAAILGFLINLAMFLQVNYTTPLTNTISGTAKAGLQTLLGVIIFQNPISFVNGLGILLCLGGSAYYAYVRMTERSSTPPERDQYKHLRSSDDDADVELEQKN